MYQSNTTLSLIITKKQALVPNDSLTEFNERIWVQSVVSNFSCFLICQTLCHILHKSRIYWCIRLPQHERNNWTVLGIIIPPSVQKQYVDVAVDNFPTRLVLWTQQHTSGEKKCIQNDESSKSAEQTVMLTSRWKQTLSMSRVGTPKHLILTASAFFQWLWMSSNMLWVTPPFPRTTTQTSLANYTTTHRFV